MSLVRRVKKLEVGVPGQVVMTEELRAVAEAKFMREMTPHLTSDTPPHPAEEKYTEAQLDAAIQIVVAELFARVDGATRNFARANLPAE